MVGISGAAAGDGRRGGTLQSGGVTRLEGAKGWEGRERVPGRWNCVLKGYGRGLTPPGRGCKGVGV